MCQLHINQTEGQTNGRTGEAVDLGVVEVHVDVVEGLHRVRVRLRALAAAPEVLAADQAAVHVHVGQRHAAHLHTLAGSK